MKTITLSLISAMLGIANFSQAAVRTADNRTGAPNDGVHNFSSLQAAVNASSANDTVYVQGSAVIYAGTVSIGTVPLVIIGPGHNPAVQNPLSAQVVNFDVTASASGSKIIGLNFSGQLNYHDLTNNITVQRCKFGTGVSGIFNIGNSTIYNWVIEGCVFTRLNFNFLNSTSASFNCANIIFRNNIFNGAIEGVISNVASPNYIINNVFINYGGYGVSDCVNCYVNNNIFYATKPGYGGFYNNNISWACSQSDFLGGTNNLALVNPQFTGYSGGNFSYTQDFHLLADSPGHNTGTDNTDRGVYGAGTNVFSMTGEPAIPQITALTNNGSSSLPQNGTLNITVNGHIIQ